MIVRKEEVRVKDRPSRVAAATVTRSRHSKLTQHYLTFEKVPDNHETTFVDRGKVRQIVPVQITTKDSDNEHISSPFGKPSQPPIAKTSKQNALASLLAGEGLIAKRGPRPRLESTPANAQGPIFFDEF